MWNCTTPVALDSAAVTPHYLIPFDPFAGIEQFGFFCCSKVYPVDYLKENLMTPSCPPSPDEAALQDLYDRRNDIEMAIRALEELQSLLQKHQKLAVVKRILSRAA
jgi:hypothetical protein